MSRQRRTLIWVAVAVAILFLVLRAVIVFRRYGRVQRAWSSIHSGQTSQDVLQLLGMPNYYAGKCGVIHVAAKGCSLEYVYSHPFAPLIPEYDIVSFTADDRVKSAEVRSSP